MCGMYTSLKSKSPTFSRFRLFTTNDNIIETVDNWRPLGHVISSNMHDAMDIAQCRHKLTGQVNDVVCTISTADPITKITLLKTYCLSLLPAGCHGNLTVLNLLSASETKNQHFRPCGKNYALDRKMIDNFYNCHDVLYQHAKFGEIELRAPAVGAKIGVFCMSCFVCLRVGDIVQTSICDGLWADFDAVFSITSEGITLSVALHSSHLRRQVAPQFSRNCRQKLRKVQKSAEKLCAPLRIVAARFEENSTAVV